MSLLPRDEDLGFTGPSERLSRLYLPLLATAVRRGHAIFFQVRGACMWPAIQAGDRVLVRLLSRPPQPGDVLVCHHGMHAVAHRVVERFQDADGRDWVRCRGDASMTLDAPILVADVVGLVAKIERAGITIPPRAAAAVRSRIVAPLRAALGRLRAALKPAVRALPPSSCPLRK